jgi:hypothetical protein
MPESALVLADFKGLTLHKSEKRKSKPHIIAQRSTGLPTTKMIVLLATL